MGYYAIVGNANDNIVVKKTNETIFINKNKNYTIFEIEIESKDEEVFKDKQIELDIIIPGKISSLKAREDLMSSDGFIEWYYLSYDYISGQRKICVNGIYTDIVDSSVSLYYDKEHNISKISLIFKRKNIPENSTNMTTFFSFINRSHTVKHFGNICSESRYFDRKIILKDSRMYEYLNKKFLYPQKLYCWFVIPRKYVASDYSNSVTCKFDSMRILENSYRLMISKLSLTTRFTHIIADKILGRPQIINWTVDTENIDRMQDKSLKEIRIFATCSSYAFAYIASIASVLGLISSVLFFIASMLFN